MQCLERFSAWRGSVPGESGAGKGGVGEILDVLGAAGSVDAQQGASGPVGRGGPVGLSVEHGESRCGHLGSVLGPGITGLLGPLGDAFQGQIVADPQFERADLCVREGLCEQADLHQGGG